MATGNVRRRLRPLRRKTLLEPLRKTAPGRKRERVMGKKGGEGEDEDEGDSVREKQSERTTNTGNNSKQPMLPLSSFFAKGEGEGEGERTKEKERTTTTNSEAFRLPLSLPLPPFYIPVYLCLGEVVAHALAQLGGDGLVLCLARNLHELLGGAAVERAGLHLPPSALLLDRPRGRRPHAGQPRVAEHWRRHFQAARE